MHTRQSVTDRYYRALYGILQDAHTQPSIKQAAFLNIMYKSLSVDPSTNRIKAFVKRLLQLCTGQQPPFVCGALYLVSEVWFHVREMYAGAPNVCVEVGLWQSVARCGWCAHRMRCLSDDCIDENRDEQLLRRATWI